MHVVKAVTRIIDFTVEFHQPKACSVIKASGRGMTHARPYNTDNCVRLTYNYSTSFMWLDTAINVAYKIRLNKS